MIKLNGTTNTKGQRHEIVSLRAIDNPEQYIDEIARVLTEAFFNDPLWANTYPDPELRKRVSYNFNKVIAKFGIKYGETCVIFGDNDEIAAVFIFLHVKKTIVSPWKMIKCGIIPVFFTRFMKMAIKNAKLFREVENFHKKSVNIPHLYGFEFAVDPKYQGKGYGRSLLMEIDRLMKEKPGPYPMYLETNNEKNVSLYEKFGFKLLGKWSSSKNPSEAFFMLREKYSN